MAKNVATVWFEYNQARSELGKALGCDGGFPQAVGNRVIALVHGVKEDRAVNQDIVALPDGRIVKTCVAMRSSIGPIRLSPIGNWDFNLLAIVIFDKDGYVESASEMTVARAREIAQFDKALNCWFIVLSESLKKQRFVHDITEQVHAVLGGRFARRSESGKSEAKGARKRVEPLSTMRNKEFAMRCIQLLKDNSRTLDADIGALMDSDYCKQLFDHRYPVLKRVTGMSFDEIRIEARDTHGNRRYYESPIVIGEDSYIVTNDWYGLGAGARDNRSPFIKWLRGKTGI